MPTKAQFFWVSIAISKLHDDIRHQKLTHTRRIFGDIVYSNCSVYLMIVRKNI